jgi:mannonate dehydratase
MVKPPLEPGVKIAIQAPPEPTEDDLQFYTQMGLRHAVLWTDETKSSAEYYASRRQLFAHHGIEVYGFGNADVHNQPLLVLGGEGRQAKIEQYKDHIRALGASGVPYTTYAHMANGIWSTEPELTRGGARGRAFNLATATHGRWRTAEYHLPMTNDREYSEAEAWANFEEFIRQVVPVAEQEGVRIGIHPDDPPIPRLGGAPRIFSRFADYKRALAIADSPNVGVCLCAGCWLEGGKEMGATVEEAIAHFASEGKLFKVHFRNVDKPLPHFVETFVDDGYADMYAIMRALVDAEFDGVAIADHIPAMAGGPRVGTAFTIGYMKALLDRARADATRAA